MQKQKPLTTSVGEMLKSYGITPAQPGPKEANKKGVATLPVRKFAFNPPALTQPQLTIRTKDEMEQEKAKREKYRHDVGPWMFDQVSQRRALFSDIETEDDAVLIQTSIDEVTTAIAEHLNQEDPLGKQMAVLAYANAMVKTCPKFRWQVEQTLQDLVGIRFLEEADEGKGVQIYGREYALTKEFSKNSEAKAVGEALSKLVSQTVAAGKARFEEKMGELKTVVGDHPLTVEELETNGRDGRMLLLTPDHSYRGKFYKGGFLLVESTGGQIRILDGVGGCQRIASQLADTDTFVWNTQLGSENPELKVQLPEEAYRNFRIAHGLLYRGVNATKKKEALYKRKADWHRQTGAERETLKARATLSPVEFFLFERQGTASLDPLGREPLEIKSREKDKDPTLVWDVIALVERDEAGRIRVTDCPERLNEFFARVREFMPPGEKFTKIPWPLGPLLRMGYAAACQEATPEQRTAANAERAQAETARKEVEVQAQQQLATELTVGTGETLEGVSIPDPTEGR